MEKLYIVTDKQGQYQPFDVQAESKAKAIILYCAYFNINALLFVDRLEAIDYDQLNGQDLKRKMLDPVQQWI